LKKTSESPQGGASGAAAGTAFLSAETALHVEALFRGLKRLRRRAESLRRSSTDARRGLAAWQVRKVTEYMKTHVGVTPGAWQRRNRP